MVRARRWLVRLAAGSALLFAVLAVLWRVLPPVSTLMVWSGLTGQGMERRYVPLERISPHLVNAVINSEDARFCSHGGVDWADLASVLGQRGGPRRGASTISMQTVKNLFLWQGHLTILRKGFEIPLAVALDTVWPKSRMIEVYLNIAEWGPGIFGAEAAARHHFSKSAADLTRREAALLAVSLPNPVARDPGRPSRGLARHAARIAARAAGNPAAADCLN